MVEDIFLVTAHIFKGVFIRRSMHGHGPHVLLELHNVNCGEKGIKGAAVVVGERWGVDRDTV